MELEAHYQASLKYLQTYLDEYNFRYNCCHDGTSNSRPFCGASRSEPASSLFAVKTTSGQS